MKYPGKILLVLGLLAGMWPSAGRSMNLQAEDYLSCPGIEISATEKEALWQIIQARRALAKTVSCQKPPMTETFFGARFDEPTEITQWRAKEDQQVRSLVNPAHMKSLLDFASALRGKMQEIENKFPLRSSVALAMTQHITTEGGQKTLMVDLSVPAECPDYLVEKTSEINQDGTMVIWLTVVRTSIYQLSSREPESSELKATISHSGTLPRMVEIWTRMVDEDLPLDVKFTRSGEVALTDS